MLKIKDDLDLKELEKFGFALEYYLDCWAWTKKYKRGKHYEEYINIWTKDRQIQCCGIEILDTIYDLIQAGYVEKVGDE